MNKVSSDGLPLDDKEFNGTIPVVLRIIEEPLSIDSSEFQDSSLRRGPERCLQHLKFYQEETGVPSL